MTVLSEIRDTVCQFIDWYDDGIFVHNRETGEMTRPNAIAGSYDIEAGTFTFTKPSTEAEMTAFLRTPEIGERGNIRKIMISRGWAKNSKEADELLASCGWVSSGLCSENGWEPGIT